MAEHAPHFTITPLGGLGEIGLNCQVWSTADSTVLIDCGLMFPDDYHLGVDVVIPRFDHILQQRDKVRGIILTHGHEDHIGALPWLVPHLRGIPIFGSRFTLALVEHKLREHGLADRVEFVPVTPGTPLALGDMTFHFLPVCHSIIEGYAVGVETPVGRVLHTGDFKIDPHPLEGSGTDLDLFRSFAGDEGVRLLLSDSTNIEREGHSLPEREILSSFRHIFTEAQGRIVITLFSSHIQRIQEVFDLAAEFGRTVVVSGRSLMTNIELAREHGFLRVPPALHMDAAGLPPVADRDMVLLVTGSQGEPLSALSRITMGEHKHLTIHEGDTVVMSSRIIPGNARAITRLINQIYRLGAEVYYDKFRAIHASGHAHRDELRAMIETMRPQCFVPVHGEYRHLVKHARLAQECGVAPERAFILENGDPLTLLPQGVRLGERIHVESILVDGKGVGDVGHSVLKERHILGGEGMVIVVLVVDEVTWDVLHGPEMLSKGFVFEQHYNHVLEDAKCIVLDIFENIPPGETERLQDRIRSALRRFFRKVLERDPIVVPVITTI
ncbi:ribonuclease J [Nitratidesulfovibrio vulgaris]|jgi:ribonuclease J|uniref:Ribonuclease J n=1 Tax=Nitratidesulfovibrio vulgaris (strain ATCC 29579 / DSM 644 / CCUG 34227 / NCIMB 8303 / VKM B-1760 / Hildenborough) TaxID=882 RepID=Q72DQ3_NITV2|nr:ribonuclease J [Nitratidesulfovibrio vulgaris]AAS95356.1 metallo-beta-lactamase family protein [Nitratidesulfovibrio vulgaris str. Hildenborough]ADP85971.1 RNA-metabolising metallo-beta-lactamase [Nitratidesulfovibrio vulgaris RCH1]